MDQSSEWGNRMQENARLREHEAAKESGRSFEDGALRDDPSKQSPVSALENAKKAEENDGFLNNVQGKALDVAAGKVPGGRMMMKRAKKLGPLGAVLVVIITAMGILAGSQSFAAFGLVANGLDQFNNLRTSMNIRMNFFTRFMLSSGRKSSPLVGKKYLIFGKDTFKISRSMNKKLAKNNIFYVDNDECNCRFLVYDDPETGAKRAVVANEGDAKKVPKNVDIEVNGEKVRVDIEGSETLSTAINKKNGGFKASYDKATRTMRGHIAGWFDELSKNFHQNVLKSSRNKQRNTDSDADEDEVIKNAKSTDEGMDEDLMGVRADSAEEVKNSDGTVLRGGLDGDAVEDAAVSKGSFSGKSSSEVEAELKTAVEGRANKIIGSAGAFTSVGCLAIRFFSMFNQMMAALMNSKILNFTTGFLEAVQKTQAGDAGTSVLSTYMNGASKKGDTYGSVLGDTAAASAKPVRSGTSALESPAWNQFFSSGSLTVQADDPVAMKYNQEYVTSQALSEKSRGLIKSSEASQDIITMLTSANAYKTCLGVGISFNLISLAITVGGVLVFGPVSLFEKLGEKVINAVKSQAIVTAISGIIASLIPHVARWFMTDFLDNMSGEDMAYAINSGFNLYLGAQMGLSAGLPATKAKLMAHWRKQQEVIASEAEYERTQRSPFDPSSKYTFVGSIVNSLMPIANTMSSPLMTISKTMNTVGSYATSLLPTARADGEAEFETSINEECPSLETLDLVGDAYCNPYFVTDMDTIDDDPEAVAEQVYTEEDMNYMTNVNTVDDGQEGVAEEVSAEEGESQQGGNFLWNDPRGDVDLDGDGEADAYNPPVNENGEYAKWILACARRESNFGLADSNIMNELGQLSTGNSGVDTVIKGGLATIPIIGDASQLIDDTKAVKNIGWITGEDCMSEQSSYYSRYSEDQRLMESAGIIEQSSITAFLEDYYKKNPIDNSTTGIIARYSGLTKDQVIETLAYVKAFDWLANYNPETYGPEKYEKKPDGSWQYESNEVIANNTVLLMNGNIVFDDLRSRSKIS